jgi:hypothetical protein
MKDRSRHGAPHVDHLIPTLSSLFSFPRFGRMQTDEEEKPAQIHDANAVEVQRRHGRASGRRQTDHPQVILAPGEMFTPDLMPWMV